MENLNKFIELKTHQYGALRLIPYGSKSTSLDIRNIDWDHLTFEMFFTLCLVAFLCWGIYERSKDRQELTFIERFFDTKDIRSFLPAAGFGMLLILLFIKGFDLSFEVWFILEHGICYLKPVTAYNVLVLITLFFATLYYPVAFFSATKQNLQYRTSEFSTYYLIAIYAGLLVLCSGDFGTLFVLLELLTFILYVLATNKTDFYFNGYAALHYFIIGSVISAFFIFGFSLLYMGLGSVEFQSIHRQCVELFTALINIDSVKLRLLTLSGLILAVITILMKTGIAPFHFWVVDVYDQSPLMTTVFFSFFPKLIYFLILTRFVWYFELAYEFARFPLFVLGVVTLYIGSSQAYREPRFKRFFVFSSVASTGFPLIGAAFVTADMQHTVLMYILVYCITTFCLWVVYLQQGVDLPEYFQRFGGKPYTMNLFLARYLSEDIGLFCASVVFLSCAGVPPLIGSSFKYYLISIVSASTSEFGIVVAVITLLSLIPVFIYVRVVKIIFFHASQWKIVPNRVDPKTKQKIPYMTHTAYVNPYFSLMSLILCFGVSFSVFSLCFGSDFITEIVRYITGWK